LKFENHQYHNCEIELDNGEKYKVSAHWLHSKQLDHWQGWECDAGYRRLEIDQNFDVYSARCKNDKLGNLFGSWSPLTSPSMCKKQTCTGCVDDLLAKKRKI